MRPVKHWLCIFLSVFVPLGVIIEVYSIIQAGIVTT